MRGWSFPTGLSMRMNDQKGEGTVSSVAGQFFSSAEIPKTCLPLYFTLYSWVHYPLDLSNCTLSLRRVPFPLSSSTRGVSISWWTVVVSKVLRPGNCFGPGVVRTDRPRPLPHSPTVLPHLLFIDDYLCGGLRFTSPPHGAGDGRTKDGHRG